MAKSKTISIDDLFRVKGITFIRLSPDGRHAVVGVRSTDTKGQRNVTCLWLYRLEDDSFDQVTNGPADGEAVWLNERTFVFPAAKRDETAEDKEKPFPRTRLYSMSVRGGEPRLRATLDGKVWEMAASPDGSRLALAYTPHPQADAAQRKAWTKTPPPVVPHHMHWKLDAVGPLPATCASVHVMDVTGRRWGVPQELTRAPEFWHAGIQWVDDERLLAIRRDPDKKDMTTEMVLARLSGRTRVLPSPICTVTSATPSPDGRRIVFTGNNDARRTQMTSRRERWRRPTARWATRPPCRT